MDSGQKVKIECLVTGVDKVNTYILACSRTGQAVIIDPGGEPEQVLKVLDKYALKAIMIINTHGHGDHVAGNQALKKILDIPTAMHRLDDEFFQDQELRREFKRILGHSCPEPADITFRDGDIITVGDLQVEVLHTPGHTPGSVCLLCAGNLFTGDTLFVGDAGRTDLPGGSLEQLLDSLERKVITLPLDTKVWPGHDYGLTPTSTIGHEMRENPYITDFILDT